MTDIERQIHFEADAVQEGVARYFEDREYQVATDFKPAKGLLANSLDALANRIRGEQRILRYRQSGQPPKYALGLLSLPAEKHAHLVHSMDAAHMMRTINRFTPRASVILQWCTTASASIDRELACG
jgi:hypothetical protein